MLRKEMKIVLPFYKIAFSCCFIFILSLVRGVAFTDEVGIAMEPPLAILAAVFCAEPVRRRSAANGRRSGGCVRRRTGCAPCTAGLPYRKSICC